MLISRPSSPCKKPVIGAVPLRSNPYLGAVAFTLVFVAGVAALKVVDLGELRALLRRPQPVATSVEVPEQLSHLVPDAVGTEL